MAPTTRSHSASVEPASRAPGKKATTTRSKPASAKPASRAPSKKATTTASPIKKARAPAHKRRAAPRQNAEAQPGAPSNDTVSEHGSDNDANTPPRRATPRPQILTVIHPSDRALTAPIARLPAAHHRLRIRHRRDLATHLPELVQPNEHRIATLEGQVAALQNDNNRLRGKWTEELKDAVELEELAFLREMVDAKQAALEVEKVVLDLRFELMLRIEMKYD